MAMEYESAVVNGLIEDFATVVCFFIDCFYFGMEINFWNLLGCCLVGYVVLSISFGNLK
jgi:hypothetical protein